MKYHQGRLIDHVHLRVKDLERSRRFYKAVLQAIEMSHDYGEAEGYCADNSLDRIDRG